MSGWCRGQALGGVSLACWREEKKKKLFHLNTPKLLQLNSSHLWRHHTPRRQVETEEERVWEALNHETPPCMLGWLVAGGVDGAGGAEVSYESKGG